ncbi:unnamed protein product [Rhodiola kirilowii]
MLQSYLRPKRNHVVWILFYICTPCIEPSLEKILSWTSSEPILANDRIYRTTSLRNTKIPWRKRNLKKQQLFASRVSRKFIYRQRRDREDQRRECASLNMATETKQPTEEVKMDLFEDDDEFEEFEINEEWEVKEEGNEITQQWEDDWDDDDVSDDFSLQLRRELEDSAKKN